MYKNKQKTLFLKKICNVCIFKYLTNVIVHNEKLFCLHLSLFSCYAKNLTMMS